MSSPTADLRKSIVAGLSVALGGSWTVSAEPPDVVNTPAVVIGPGDPYRQPLLFKSNDIRLRATVLISGNVVSPLDELDEALDTVTRAIDTLQEQVVVTQVGSVGLAQEIGGVTLLTASIDITASIGR